MTNLPKTLREALSQARGLYTSATERDVASSDGTRKLLLRWPDQYADSMSICSK